MPDFFSSITIDSAKIEQRIAQLPERLPNIEDLKWMISLIDFTSLEGTDTQETIKQFCYKAKHLSATLPGFPHVATVCVYPTLVRAARKELIGTEIKAIAVAGAFPSGQSSIKIRLAEVQYALDEGAEEIDTVISRGKFLEGHYREVFDEIAAIKELCKDVSLKVILETGELGTLSNVRKASDIAMHAGADFIKTSTGKIATHATLPAVCVMLDAIVDFYKKSGRAVGIKPSGGIAETKTALRYLTMTESILGKEWITPSRFRFGTSRLVNAIITDSGS